MLKKLNKKCNCKKEKEENLSITVKIKNRIKNFKRSIISSQSLYCRCEPPVACAYTCIISDCDPNSCECPGATQEQAIQNCQSGDDPNYTQCS